RLVTIALRTARRATLRTPPPPRPPANHHNPRDCHHGPSRCRQTSRRADYIAHHSPRDAREHCPAFAIPPLPLIIATGGSRARLSPESAHRPVGHHLARPRPAPPAAARPARDPAQLRRRLPLLPRPRPRNPAPTLR